ncbi:MAG: DUF4240 domain-containing protein [Roseibium sp.]|uniref:DUF4240 domain-containing protein n=1 Tax=Roseibium sp. TaxID=1936156 RepID=UPI003299D4C9
MDKEREDWFWGIIDTVANKSGRAAKSRNLYKALRLKTAPELIDFMTEYNNYLAKAYRFDLWRAADLIDGELSDDSFWYFRDWLISTGRSYYEAVLADPDRLVESLDWADAEGHSFESFGYVAGKIYEKRFGALTAAEETKIYDELSDVHQYGQPAGGTHEDSFDLRFPKLEAGFEARMNKLEVPGQVNLLRFNLN